MTDVRIYSVYSVFDSTAKYKLKFPYPDHLFLKITSIIN